MMTGAWPRPLADGGAQKDAAGFAEPRGVKRHGRRQVGRS